MSHFEIVRSDAEQPYHARFRASNGRILFTSEQYTRRAKALSAIRILATYHARVEPVEVRDVDERGL